MGRKGDAASGAPALLLSDHSSQVWQIDKLALKGQRLGWHLVFHSNIPIPILNPGCKINMGAYCSVQIRITWSRPPKRRRVKRWPTNGKEPGGQGNFRNGDSLSSTNLYTSHKMRSSSAHRSTNFQLHKLLTVSKIILARLLLKVWQLD